MNLLIASVDYNNKYIYLYSYTFPRGWSMYTERFEVCLDEIISQVSHISLVSKTERDDQQNIQRARIPLFAPTSTSGLPSVQSNYFSL